MTPLNPKKAQELNELCISLLKSKKLSVTAPRISILTLLLREHGPFSTEDIFKKLPKNSCDLATIYRCLNQFVETELVSLTHFDKDQAFYEYNDPNHHHHHIVCKICKKMESIHECIISEIEKNLKARGYAQITHRLEVFGICKVCQDKA